MSAIGVLIGDVSVTGEFRVNLCVGLDTLKAIFDVVLLRLDRFFCGG